MRRGVMCQNHGAMQASHVSEMPSAERPYKVTVPLCAACAERIEAIGFPVQRIVEANQ